MKIEFKPVQIELTSDKKELLNELAHQIREALNYALDAFTKYGEWDNRFADIENHEFLFDDKIGIYVTARVEERIEDNYFSIDEIAVLLDGEEVDLLIEGHSLKSMRSDIEKILTN